MVSFAHVRTQAHDNFYSQAGAAAVGAVKTKKGARMQFCYRTTNSPQLAFSSANSLPVTVF